MQTQPYKVVTGVAITPQQPFEHLYTHVKQRDPKLYETISRLSTPANLTPNLSNPLQAITFVLSLPAPGDKTNRVTVMSNLSTDESMYFPVSLDGNLVLASSTDVNLDIQVSHDSGANFISLLAQVFTIPAGSLVPINPTISFAKGAYLRNRDLVYGQLTSSSFNGSEITYTLLFQ